MRVPRSFSFVDLSGFTAFTDANGDEEAGRVLSEFRRAVRDVASRRGVRVAKWQGDGAMFVGVEPAPLVQAVLELEERLARDGSPLGLRGGMTLGNVILFEGDDYIGSAVNLASRLCDSAEPHEILAGIELTPHVPPWAVAEPVVPVAVRGFSHRVPVMRVHRRVDGPLVLDPICGMEIPSDAVSVTRTGPEGGEVGFCAESCAQAWDEKIPLA